jgi:nucleosome binding factor SPN SPT16 subunit
MGRWDAEDEEEDRIDEERRRAKEAEEMRIRQEQEEKERQEEEERLRVEEEARQVGTDGLPFHSHVRWRYIWTMCCWVVFIYRVIVVYSDFFFLYSITVCDRVPPPTHFRLTGGHRSQEI